MSGIAGIIHFDGRPADPVALKAMTDAMAYRGPDGIHHRVQGSVALAHCQLATTAEASGELQPLAHGDAGLVLVCDGRIDNRDVLLRDLLAAGAVLHHRTDAELVLRSYEHWGERCVDRIEGDFAFVVWDERRRRAFCARDSVGMRRFFYHFDSGRFVFATDLHAILASGLVPERLNAGLLAELLGPDFKPLEQTCWKDVLRLLPAHSMRVDANGAAVQLYWQPDFEARLPCRSDSDYIDCYRDALIEAVRRVSRASGPLAFDVSGGLDSSALFAVGDRLLRQGRLPAPAVIGYHMHVPDDDRADERFYARAMADHLGRPVHEVEAHVPTLDEYAAHSRRFRDMPEPMNAAIVRSIAARAAADGCRVSVNGSGGDEWTRGYPNHPDAIRALDFRTAAGVFADDIREAGLPRALWRAGRWGLVPLVRPGLDFTPPHVELTWLTPEAREFVARRSESRRTEGPRNKAIARQSRFLAHRFASHEAMELLYATMGMEMRSPFWSRPLIETCIAIPERLRRRALQNKWLHRQAMSGYLPEAVRGRGGKANFVGVFERREAQLRHEVATRVLARAGNWIEPAFGAKLGDGGSLTLEEGAAMWTLFGIDALVSARGFPEPVEIC